MITARSRRVLRGLVVSALLVAGLGYAPAAFSTISSDASHDFGERAVGGAPSQYSFVISSDGASDPVTFASYAVNGVDAADFSIGTNQCAVATFITMLSPCSIAVDFAPGTVGNKVATLDITSDDNSLSIPLSGSAIDPEAAVTPPSIAFGNQGIAGGATATQQIMIANNGASSLSVLDVSLVGADPTQFAITTETCTLGPVSPPGTCTINVAFDPDTIGAKGATVQITTNAAASIQNVSLTGTGVTADATALPASLAFGSQDITAGATATQAVTVTSTGASALTVNAPTLTGTDSGDFTISSQDCTVSSPITNPGTCTIDVAFDPSTVGSKSATLHITSDASSSPHDIALTGTATGPDASVAPTSIDFGSQDVGSGATGVQSVTLTSNGTSSVTPGTPTLVGATPGDFAIGIETCSVAGPMSAATTCSVQVTFDPSSTGTISAILRIPSDGTSAPHDVALTGTGTVPDGSVAPATIAFGTRAIAAGPSAATTVTFTSTGGSPVTPAVPTLIGADAASFTLSNNTCVGSPIAAPGTCSVDVAFDPSSTGVKSATLSVTSDAVSAPHSVTLGGTGTDPVANGSGSSIAFGDQDIDAGATAARTITVQSAGSTPLTVSSVVLGDTTNFSITSQNCTSAAIVAPGFCSIQVVFDPASTGVKSTTLQVVSDAASSPTSFSLTGTGTTTTTPPATGPATPSAPANLRASFRKLRAIGLAWDASTISTNESLSYVMYVRAAGESTWSELGATTNLFSSVSSLDSGTSFEFQVVAVTADGTQSDPSDVLKVSTEEAVAPIFDVVGGGRLSRGGTKVRLMLRCVDPAMMKRCTFNVKFQLLSGTVRWGSNNERPVDPDAELHSCGGTYTFKFNHGKPRSCRLRGVARRDMYVLEPRGGGQCRIVSTMTGTAKVVVAVKYTDDDGKEQVRTRTFNIDVYDKRYGKKVKCALP